MDNNKPKMMTVRAVARTGILPEHALWILLKAGKLPAIYIGKKALINYERLGPVASRKRTSLRKSARDQSIQNRERKL